MPIIVFWALLAVTTNTFIPQVEHVAEQLAGSMIPSYAPSQVAMLRPEQIRLLDEPLPGLSTARCRVEDVIDIGAHTTVIVSGNDVRLTIRLPGGTRKPARGGDVLVGFDPADIRILEE